METPSREPAGDRAGLYLASALALDPASDAAEILRLRRAFLGKPAGPESRGDGGEGRPDAEARLAAVKAREEAARRKGAALTKEHRPARAAAPQARAPAPRPAASGGNSWLWYIVIFALIRVIILAMKGS